MAPLLTAMSPPRLEELKLGITPADDSATTPDLAHVAELLDSTALRTIGRLTIVYNGPLQLADVVERLQATFSETRYRDIIQVVLLF